MNDERAIDHAVHLALDRTLSAQADVEHELADGEPPQMEAVETVVHRAEDLDVLVRESRDARDET